MSILNSRRMLILAVSLGLSGGLSGMFFTDARAVDVINSTNNGQIIRGGTYFNTPDGKTTFINTGKTGIWLKSGSNLRGVEVDAVGTPTRNGGSVKIDAPGQVVRLDGNIDVRGLRDSAGQYMGNGGNVWVNSEYLYQNGNIYANGFNGGLVQFNVASATLGSTARIEVKGEGSSSSSLPNDIINEPEGGTISINSKGPVDIRNGAIMTSQGVRSDINIEGSLVNMEGRLVANGTLFNSGTIRLIGTGQSNLQSTEAALQTATKEAVFSPAESSGLINGLKNLATEHDGDIVIKAPDSSGPRGFLYSKTIIFAAWRDIQNGGWILADGTPTSEGAHAGVISLNAGSRISNSGRISANGTQPDGLGGILTLHYKDGMSNSGAITATGFSRGGLIVFSGPTNPTSNGLIAAINHNDPSVRGAGTIVLPDPNRLSNSNRLITASLAKTQPFEVIWGGFNFEGAIILKTSLPDHPRTDFTPPVYRSSFDPLATGDAESRYSSFIYPSSPRRHALIIGINDGSRTSLEYPGVSISANPTSVTVLSNSEIRLHQPMFIGFDIRNNFDRYNNFFISERGRVSILADSFRSGDGGGFKISGKTSLILREERGQVGAPFIDIFSINNNGAGTANIASKEGVGTSPAYFAFDRPESSLIIKAPNVP